MYRAGVRRRDPRGIYARVRHHLRDDRARSKGLIEVLTPSLVHQLSSSACRITARRRAFAKDPRKLAVRGWHRGLREQSPVASDADAERAVPASVGLPPAPRGDHRQPWTRRWIRLSQVRRGAAAETALIDAFASRGRARSECRCGRCAAAGLTDQLFGATPADGGARS